MHGKGRNTHGKGFAVRRRTAKTARQSLARQRVLCRAPLRTRTAKPLSCGLTFAVRRNALPCKRLCRALSRTAVRIPLPCAFQSPRTAKVQVCRAPLIHPHGKELPRHIQASSWHFLCRAYAHGKATKWSFAVRIRTAKALGFSIFLLFSLIYHNINTQY